MKSESASIAASMLASRAKKKQDVTVSSAKTKASLSDVLDPSANLIDFDNLEQEFSQFRDVDTDFLLSAGQLKARPPSGKSAVQLLRPISKGQNAPQIPKGQSMKSYIMDR